MTDSEVLHVKQPDPPSLLDVVAITLVVFTLTLVAFFALRPPGHRCDWPSDCSAMGLPESPDR